MFFCVLEVVLNNLFIKKEAEPMMKKAPERFKKMNQELKAYIENQK